MAIPTRWKTLDEVPEWAKKDVVLVDGEYVAQFDGLRPKADVDAFRERNTKLQEQVETLQAKLSGALTAEESLRLKSELETLRQQLESGADEQRIAEAIEKRTVKIRIGDREVSVLRTEKPIVEAHLKTLTDDLTAKGQREQLLVGELSKERLQGAATAAYRKLPGAKTAAEDDVVLHVGARFRMGEDFQPFMPDLEADPEGKTPKVGKDGKPLSIEGYLKEVAEAGTKAGVWFDEARGPKNRPRPAGAIGEKGTPEPFGSSRIQGALEKRRAASGG